MIRIRVELDFDRDRLGALSVFDANEKRILGPFPVAARACKALAAAHGNPRRDPLLPYGDTPAGSYVLRRIVKSGNRTAFPVAQHGANGVIVLEGIGGDAALAEANGRFHVLIEGGKPAKGDALAATAGALRLSNEHQRALVASLRKAERVTVDIVEGALKNASGRVHDDGKCVEHDPPPGTDGPTRLSRREALRTGGAAGAMAFGLSVSFVSLEPSPARAQAYPGNTTETTTSPPSTPETTTPGSPGGTPITGDNGQPISGPGVHEGPADTPPPPNPTPQPSNSPTLNQLQNLDEHGATPGTQPGIDTKDTTPPPVTVPNNNAPVPAYIQQQQEINAIQAEKPPANATQDQLNQWQADKQKRIDAILHPQ